MSTPPNSKSDWLPGEALVASLQILLMDAPRLPDGSPDTSKVNITGEALLARARQLDARSSYEGVVDLIQQGVLVPRGTDAQQGTFRLNLTLYALTPEERANLLRGQSFRLNSERLRQYAANLPARVAVANITAQDAKAQAAYRAAQSVTPPPVPPKPGTTRVTPPGAEVPRPVAHQPRPPSPGVAPHQATTAAAAGQAPPQPVPIGRAAAMALAFETGNTQPHHDLLAHSRLNGMSAVHQAALLSPPGAGTSPGSNARNQQAASNPGSNARNQQAASTTRTPPPRVDSLAGSEKQRATLSKRR